MSTNYWNTLNWLERWQLAQILEGYGFAVSPSESDDDLRDAIAENIEDGTISPHDLEVIL